MEGNEMKKTVAIIMALTLGLTASATAWAGAKETGAAVRTVGKVYLPDIIPQKTFISGDFEYTIGFGSSTASITDFLGDAEEVEIPSRVDGIKVTEIAPGAMSYKDIRRITFPDTLEVIGQNAFEYCELTGVEIPENVQVGRCAFDYCDSLKRVLVAPGAVIGERAFGYCNDLETVICGDGSTLDANAFEYCDDLAEVILCGNVSMNEYACYDCYKMEIVNADAAEYDRWQLDENEPVERVHPAKPRMSGGWEVTEDAAVTEVAQKVFDLAMPDHDRLDHEAVALLATQVVAGINYCFLVRTGDKDSDEPPVYQIVYIWQDPAGNVQVIETKDLEFGLSPQEDADFGEADVTSYEGN